jgi:hypothetical protein
VLETGKIGQRLFTMVLATRLVILVASICVPAAKLACYLSAPRHVHRGVAYHAAARSCTGCWISSAAGRLDIYVGGLLVGLVPSSRWQISPGPGAIAFGAVVVLTMLASHGLIRACCGTRGRRIRMAERIRCAPGSGGQPALYWALLIWVVPVVAV